MEIEVLHNMEGDKKRKFDTKTAVGRKEAEQFFKKLFRGGTAIFFETKHGTYRVVKYDPDKDALTVRVDKNGKSKEVRASAHKGRQTAVPPRAGG